MATAPTVVQMRSVTELRPHPLNDRVYGDDGAEDLDLRASVRSLGVLMPLVVLPDGRIVSGHRRWGAARAEGLTEVPTTDYAGDPQDETEIKAAILEHNRQRVKTEDQRAREIAAMLEVEHERGLKKKAHGQTAPGRTLGASDAPSVDQPANGRAPKSSAIVGDLLGMGARTVEKAAAVIKQMDDMIAAGDYKAAEDLRQTLNKAGIGPAYKEVRKARGQPTGPIRPPAPPPPLVPTVSFDALTPADDLAAEKQRWLAEHKQYRRAIGPTPQEARDTILRLFPDWWVDELVDLLRGGSE